MRSIGLPITPGSDGTLKDEATAPMKPGASASCHSSRQRGGGGQGDQVQTTAGEFINAIRPPAPKPRLLQKAVMSILSAMRNPRHVEIQVLADEVETSSILASANAQPSGGTRLIEEAPVTGSELRTS
jgi:acetyl/propionyl-CoA carboxylase alpha subunit